MQKVTTKKANYFKYGKGLNNFKIVVTDGSTFLGYKTLNFDTYEAIKNFIDIKYKLNNNNKIN
jgi:hypothetical protein